MKTTALLVLVLSVLGLTACEKSPPPPPPDQSGPLSGLSEHPNSMLGKSAAAGRDVKRQMEVEQDQAGAMADQITGQAQAVSVGGVVFRPPANWQKTAPASNMEAAALTTPSGATCVFLSGIGGSVEANLNRWHTMVTNPSTGQPADMTTSTRTVDGMNVTMVAMNGTYSSMASGAPVPMQNQGFRGAIVEAPSGNIFVRLSGPEDAVKASAADWESMVLAARK